MSEKTRTHTIHGYAVARYWRMPISKSHYCESLTTGGKGAPYAVFWVRREALQFKRELAQHLAQGTELRVVKCSVTYLFEGKD